MNHPRSVYVLCSHLCNTHYYSHPPSQYMYRLCVCVLYMHITKLINSLRQYVWTSVFAIFAYTMFRLVVVVGIVVAVHSILPPAQHSNAIAYHTQNIFIFRRFSYNFIADWLLFFNRSFPSHFLSLKNGLFYLFIPAHTLCACVCVCVFPHLHRHNIYIPLLLFRLGTFVVSRCAKISSNFPLRFARWNFTFSFEDALFARLMCRINVAFIGCNQLETHIFQDQWIHLCRNIKNTKCWWNFQWHWTGWGFIF